MRAFSHIRIVSLVLVSSLAAACGGNPGGGADDVVDPDGGGGGIDAADWRPDGVTVLYDGPEHPNGVVVDATTVYWIASIDSMLSSIRARTLATGAERTIVSATSGATFLYQDATSLYYFSAPDQIMVVAKSGSEPRVVASGATDQRVFAVAGDRVYWSANGSLYSITKQGTDQRTLGTLPAPATYVAADATSVYASTSGGLYAMPASGGNASLMTAETPGVDGNILAHGDYVYFSDRRGNRVVRVPKAGPQGTFDAIGGTQEEPGRLAADDRAVFWVDRPQTSQGRVLRLDNGASSTVQLAMPEYPADVFVTSTAVFWSDYGRNDGGALMVAPR